MRPPPSLHSNFFSSLKQVEKRLKAEHPPQLQPSNPQPQPESNCLSTESLSSPLYLHLGQSNSHTSTLQDSSEPPQEFLSVSPQFPQTQKNLPQSNILDRPEPIIESESETETDAVDDIQRLIKLLGLSDCNSNKEEVKDRQRVGLHDGNSGDCCDCEGGFYAKIVGLKGPKCGKEVERLEGWIEHFMNGGGGGGGEEERREPLRLAHLLLGKAAFLSEGADGGFGGLEFPSTIDDFLQIDPPKH